MCLSVLVLFSVLGFVSVFHVSSLKAGTKSFICCSFALTRSVIIIDGPNKHILGEVLNGEVRESLLEGLCKTLSCPVCEDKQDKSTAL